MKNIKKRYVFILILVGLLVIPIYKYVRWLNFYYRFSSEINLYTDSIFKEKKRIDSFVPTVFDANARLFYLCKIWGFIKYYREDARLSVSQMDNLLLANIPRVKRADSKGKYCAILDSLIEYPAISQTKNKNPYPDLNDYALINNEWMDDTICLDYRIKKKLEAMFYSHSGRGNRFVFNKSIGNIALIDELEYASFPKRDMRLVGLFQYWNLINYFYVYKNSIEGDWDRILYESIPLFEKADLPKKYHLEIYRLTNRLRDTHASYPATIDGLVFGPYRPNFRMSLINDTFVINQIRIPAYDKGAFEIGDIVLKVDGRDIHQLADSLKEFVCGGNYWSNQMFICNAILSQYDSATVFTLLRDGETLRTKSDNYSAYDLFQKERLIDRNNEKLPLYHWVNDSIAYLNLRSASVDNIYDNYDAIKTASAIILDLRSYPYTDIISPLTNMFVPPNSFFAYSTYSDTRFPGMLRYHRSSSNKIGSVNYYKGRIIILVNEWTRSFSEYLTMALQVNPRSITVGNSTSGSDGNVSLFTFLGKVLTTYSGIGIYYPDFSPTQRVGVRIDCIAEPSIQSIKDRIDVAYERAVIIAKGGTN